MASKNGFLALCTIIGVLAVSQVALVQDSKANGDSGVDSHDFLIWQQQVSFSPHEKLEIIVGQVERRRGRGLGSDAIFTIVVTNAGGDIIGEVQLDNAEASNDRRKSGRSRGFGFVTMGSADGVLTIDDEPSFGQLTKNSQTGRVILGLALFSSHPPHRGQGRPGATIAIVDKNGLTKAGFSIVSDPGVGIRAPG